MADCLFCKIASKEQKADMVYEDVKMIAFKDINPKAPVHILVIPKKHIDSVNHIEDLDQELIGYLVLKARDIARDQGVVETGYKLLFNVGRGGGQLIDHLHLHLMGGWK